VTGGAGCSPRLSSHVTGPLCRSVAPTPNTAFHLVSVVTKSDVSFRSPPPRILICSLRQQAEDRKVVAQDTHAFFGSLRAASERDGGVCSVRNAREHVEFQSGFQSACPLEAVNGFKNQLQRGSRCLARGGCIACPLMKALLSVWRYLGRRQAVSIRMRQ
jgi:hypothetical protein